MLVSYYSKQVYTLEQFHTMLLFAPTLPGMGRMFRYILLLVLILLGWPEPKWTDVLGLLWLWSVFTPFDRLRTAAKGNRGIQPYRQW